MKIELAVNGTLMRGLELNHNLLELTLLNLDRLLFLRTELSQLRHLTLQQLLVEIPKFRYLPFSARD